MVALNSKAPYDKLIKMIENIRVWLPHSLLSFLLFSFVNIGSIESISLLKNVYIQLLIWQSNTVNIFYLYKNLKLYRTKKETRWVAVIQVLQRKEIDLPPTNTNLLNPKYLLRNSMPKRKTIMKQTTLKFDWGKYKSESKSKTLSLHQEALMSISPCDHLYFDLFPHSLSYTTKT